jgi:hypothetical protein
MYGAEAAKREAVIDYCLSEGLVIDSIDSVRPKL